MTCGNMAAGAAQTEQKTRRIAAIPQKGRRMEFDTGGGLGDASGGLTVAALTEYGRKHECSDIHITSHRPPTFRKLGLLEPGPFKGSREEYRALILSMLNEPQTEALALGKDLDFSFEDAHGQRYRVNVYRQQNELAAALRILRNGIPSMADLHLPSAVQRLAEQPRGIVLVTGPTGSGKSTTLAAMIDYINETRKAHIITIEDPIEYIHPSKNCLVHQRELHRDVPSFSDALRSAMREDPDVILVGEMRDYETISAAVTAAETGHLVLSTLHTTGAAQTLDRIVDVYPSHSQGMIRSQLSGVFRGVVTQTLVPLADGSGRIAATEILIGVDAVLNLIREGKYHQLGSTMQAGAQMGMHTLAGNLAELTRKGLITRETAEQNANNKAELAQYLGF
ncbi:MAG: type IV pilus twitching motility protein PilT [Clostridiales Family XIII bacterium]|jgi:twitching motility protein PilT|nr:type IV pilus twitching motility protein PilT [Clostridiales Family XIII bacterium]